MTSHYDADASSASSERVSDEGARPRAMIRVPLNALATASSNLRSDEPIGLCLTLDDARVVLEHWKTSGQRLGFSFLRAAEGVVLAGHATVARVSTRSLVLERRDLRFDVAIANACIEFTQAEFCRPGVKLIDVEGLSISLANDDWLFLFQERGGRARYSRYDGRRKASVCSQALASTKGHRRRAH
jgi:hypothetical protein